MNALTTVAGGCHCGAVRFEADVDRNCNVLVCNCSICKMSGFQHLIVPAERFSLVAGKQHLKEYRFRTKTACHLFCSRCGVKAFYVPRSHPDSYSLNVRCIDSPRRFRMKISEFDGRNWSGSALDLGLHSVERDG